VVFEEDEAWRINRARLAIHLHKFPHEIDAAGLEEMMDVAAVIEADNRQD